MPINKKLIYPQLKTVISMYQNAGNIVTDSKCRPTLICDSTIPWQKTYCWGRNCSQSCAPYLVKFEMRPLNIFPTASLKPGDPIFRVAVPSGMLPLTKEPTKAPSIYALHADRIAWAWEQKWPDTRSSKC